MFLYLKYPALKGKLLFRFDKNYHLKPHYWPPYIYPRLYSWNGSLIGQVNRSPKNNHISPFIHAALCLLINVELYNDRLVFFPRYTYAKNRRFERGVNLKTKLEGTWISRRCG